MYVFTKIEPIYFNFQHNIHVCKTINRLQIGSHNMEDINKLIYVIQTILCSGTISDF